MEYSTSSGALQITRSVIGRRASFIRYVCISLISFSLGILPPVSMKKMYTVQATSRGLTAIALSTSDRNDIAQNS